MKCFSPPYRIKIRYLIVVALLSSGLKATGQSSEPLQFKSYITLNFISPFVGISPRWKTGIYMPVYKSVYVGTELGFGSTLLSPEARIKIGPNYCVQHDYKSFEIGPELIVMVHPKHFLSLKYGHLSHSSTIEGGTFLNEKENLFYDFEALDYDRTVKGFIFFYGYMDTISKRIGVIFKVGLGDRDREISFTNIKNMRLSSDQDPPNLGPKSDGSGGESDVFRFDLKLYYLLR